MIVQATAADAAETVQLWEACGLTRPWNDPQADFHRALATATSTVFLFKGQSGLKGSAMAGFDGHRGWIYYLAVAPDERNRGIATELLRAATNWFRDQGCPNVELMVRSGNDAASELYVKLGWEKQPVDVYGIWTETN